nr:MAG TPA: hypothetical protein [Caudoviricetes sp.]
MIQLNCKFIVKRIKWENVCRFELIGSKYFNPSKLYSLY